MMHNNKPYSFEKTEERGLFLLNFSCTKVQSKDVSPIAVNKDIDVIDICGVFKPYIWEKNYILQLKNVTGARLK